LTVYPLKVFKKLFLSSNFKKNAIMGTVEMRKKVKKFIDEADDHLVKLIYSMLEADREEDWWAGLPKDIQKSVLKAEKELRDGKGVPHEVVMKKYSKWLTK